jgi:hypothetical protein
MCDLHARQIGKESFVARLLHGVERAHLLHRTSSSRKFGWSRSLVENQ